MLSSLQLDALKEFMNVSIGQAANLLSEMADQKIKLTIPEIELNQISSQEKKSTYEPLSHIIKGHIVSSSLSFGNEFKGKAQLVFPVKKGKILVGLFMGDEVSLENEGLMNDFSDTDIDAMKEIGNILLNTIVGSFANLLDKNVIYSLPEVEFLYYPEQMQEFYFDFDAGCYVLLMHTTFFLVKAKIEGAILIILTLDSVSSLISKIDEMLVEIYE